MSVLGVQDLHVEFSTKQGIAQAVGGVSFEIDAKETHVLVGESGCGKSVTALAIMGLLPADTPKPRGKIILNGRDLLDLYPDGFGSVRGSEIGMIFQEPMTALNPVMRVGDQILEAVNLHPSRSLESTNEPGKKLSPRERVLELIELTGLPAPDQMFSKYPHELSGGMRQRIMIGIALASRPSILIADEPTTALDVTTQAQILSLIQDLQKRTGTAILLITHNLGVVAQVGHKMSVMYAGEIVEQGSVRDVFESPCHPYTKALFGALPRLEGGQREKLNAVRGSVPPATEYGTIGSPCRFFPRCEFQDDRCFAKDNKNGHWSRCGREGHQ